MCSHLERKNMFIRRAAFGFGLRFDHVEYLCPRLHDDDKHCPYCDDGLTSCVVCGAFEAQLPTQCPGECLAEQTLRSIYAGQLDFRRGCWEEEVPSLYCPRGWEEIYGLGYLWNNVYSCMVGPEIAEMSNRAMSDSFQEAEPHDFHTAYEPQTIQDSQTRPYPEVIDGTVLGVRYEHTEE